jgi:hypothetical protein
MALTEQEKAFVSALKKSGKTSTEITGIIANQRRGVQAQAPEQSQSMFAVPSPSAVVQSSKEVATGFGKGLVQSAVGTAQAIQGLGQRGLAAVSPQSLEQVQSQTGFKSLQGAEAEQINELLKSDTTGEKTGKVLAFATELLTPTGSRKAIEKGVSKAEQIAGTVADVADEGVGALRQVGTTIGDMTEGVRAVGGEIVEGVSRIPSRVAVNVAEKQATRQAIQSLPTRTAKEAVQEGVDIRDVQEMSKIDKTFKEPARKLVKVVQDFSSGASKTNPIEVVGKPIVNRIKQLESARGQIGQKLGEVAGTLGKVSKQEVLDPVFTSLKKVPGLSGIKINKKGLLDFTDTVLTTAETKADRVAIQKIFNDAVKSGTGKSKHLLRQELFEVLGGKKKALTNLTDTQEKAYEAIRKGLSNVLDTKNSTYKTLNQEFARVAQPLSEIRKFMKNTVGATEDILDMQAGLLARRLTSNAQSNPQIRAILKAMDSATKVKGKAQLSVEKLQDFYNILDKYYDIAGKTGFQGQVKAGVEKGIPEAIMGAVRDVAGSTNATRTKALENLLNDLLK